MSGARTAAVRTAGDDVEAPQGGGGTPEGFAASILAGLAERPKRIEAKWLYDSRGSKLFEAITRLEEYYPTCTETAILRERAAEIAEAVGPGAVLFEPGAGSGAKASILLAAIEAPGAYVPADINAAHLTDALADLRGRHPGLDVRPLAMDFAASMRLPDALGGPVAAFFPGSTIGNFEPGGARDLLRRFRTQAGAASLVIGFDLVKDRAVLEAAYDDRDGVTVAFNLNLLARINRELGAAFDLEAFGHVALFDAEASRIEMHLESLRDQSVTVAGRVVHLAAGERVCTEHSYKFTVPSFEALARDAGWRMDAAWTDPGDLFAVAHLRPVEGGMDEALRGAVQMP